MAAVLSLCLPHIVSSFPKPLGMDVCQSWTLLLHSLAVLQDFQPPFVASVHFYGKLQLPTDGHSRARRLVSQCEEALLPSRGGQMRLPAL